MKKLFVPAILAGALSVALLAGCSTTPTHTNTPEASGKPTAVTAEPSSPVTMGHDIVGEQFAAGSTVKVDDILNTIPIAAETNDSTYVRTKFKHWVSKNDTGCDTRVAVLIRDSKTKPVMNGCTVVSGDWVSAYDDKTYTKPGGMDIDHVVPLAEAWRSGAYGWTAQTRENYANDLGYSHGLLEVSVKSNRTKGDKSPADWMPATDACNYLTWWVSVKYRWGLTMDQTEHDKIVKFLSFCPEGLTAKAPEKASVQKDGSVTAIPDASTPAPSTQAEQPSQPTQAPQSDAPATSAPAAGGNDPQFPTCSAATAEGYGPYQKGVDPEYDWYQDRDGDGTVCE